MKNCQPTSRVNQRESNLELLRIVAMALIVIEHIFGHGYGVSRGLSQAVIPFAAVGVNLFILITGYFGIRFKWKSLFNLLLIVITYKLLNEVLVALFLQQPLMSGGSRFKIGYWFIGVYFELYLIAPMLNRLLKSTPDRSLWDYLGILFFINCILGFLLKNDINRIGMNLMQFVFLYFIGHAIRRFHIHERLRAFAWVAVYLGCSATVAAAILLTGKWITHNNNPLVLCAAIALFCFFLKFKFHSKAVNTVAATAFAVYLLTDGRLGDLLLYPLAHDFYLRHAGNLPLLLLCPPAATLCAFALAFLADGIRQRLTNPIVDAAGAWCAKHHCEGI